MPDLPFDVAVANRFISSLSKSLQALCHGCMDFDSGIEIVGYINVNIDCGSKVDYVLNEKVSKSTNNSMTFVSNSFLAKKEQPKQTRDGACSPIPEVASPRFSYQGARGYSHSSWNRSGYHGSYHRGAQKRGNSGDWRGAVKRHRPTPSSTAGAQFASPVSTYGFPRANETLTTASFQQQYSQNSGSFVTNQSDENGTSEVNIKKETFEGVEETQAPSENSEQKVGSDSSDFTGVNIKSDPDGNPDTASDTLLNTKSETQESSDFKGTFLQPPQDNQDNNESAHTSESSDQKIVADQSLSFDTPFPNPDSLSAVGENEGGSNEHEALDKSGTTRAGGDDTSDHAPVEYDTAAEDPEYPDGGEGTSSGQFEVIEIDDEDEDVQAMFGTPRHSSPQSSYNSAFHSLISEGSTTLSPKGQYVQDKRHSKKPCTSCSLVFDSYPELNEHMNYEHGYKMSYICSICGKGYQTSMGLHYHNQLHAGVSFTCSICDRSFTRNSTLKNHLRMIHNVSMCPTCRCLFPLGSEYAKHVVNCGLSVKRS